MSAVSRYSSTAPAQNFHYFRDTFTMMQVIVLSEYDDSHLITVSRTIATLFEQCSDDNLFLRDTLYRIREYAFCVDRLKKEDYSFEAIEREDRKGLEDSCRKLASDAIDSCIEACNEWNGNKQVEDHEYTSYWALGLVGYGLEIHQIKNKFKAVKIGAALLKETCRSGNCEAIKIAMDKYRVFLPLNPFWAILEGYLKSVENISKTDTQALDELSATTIDALRVLEGYPNARINTTISINGNEGIAMRLRLFSKPIWVTLVALDLQVDVAGKNNSVRSSFNPLDEEVRFQNLQMRARVAVNTDLVKFIAYAGQGLLKPSHTTLEQISPPHTRIAAGNPMEIERDIRKYGELTTLTHTINSIASSQTQAIRSVAPLNVFESLLVVLGRALIIHQLVKARVLNNLPFYCPARFFKVHCYPLVEDTLPFHRIDPVLNLISEYYGEGRSDPELVQVQHPRSEFSGEGNSDPKIESPLSVHPSMMAALCEDEEQNLTTVQACVRYEHEQNEKNCLKRVKLINKLEPHVFSDIRSILKYHPPSPDVTILDLEMFRLVHSYKPTSTALATATSPTTAGTTTAAAQVTGISTTTQAAASKK